MLEKRNLIHITIILLTILLVSLLTIEIFFPSRPQKAAAVMAVENYGGGINPWINAKIIATIDAIPHTITVLVDYTNSQQRCIAAHQVYQRLLSGISIYAIETVCALSGIEAYPFEINVNKYNKLYLLMGFSYDKNAQYVRSIWANGDVQEIAIENGIFVFYQSSENEIKYIVGLDSQRQTVTKIFSIP